jgi:hypothetical protein
VGYDGRKDSLSGAGFQGYLRVHRCHPGSVVRLEVLRDGEALQVDLRL